MGLNVYRSHEGDVDALAAGCWLLALVAVADKNNDWIDGDDIVEISTS